MAGRQTILVAGATGSISYAAAVALARRGAQVVLLGRRADRLQSKADSIRGVLTDAGVDHQAADVAALVIDFSDMDSVRAAADEALDRFPAIDGLVLSVGALIQNGPTVLPSGHEAMFTTNVMGTFLFTELLRGAWNLRQPLGTSGVGARNRMQETGGVRMGRCAIYISRLAGLHDSAAIHHSDSIGDLRNHTKIVGDPYDGHPQISLKPLNQGDDLALNGDIECRCWFVCYQQPRIACQGDCDHHSLAHAP